MNLTEVVPPGHYHVTDDDNKNAAIFVCQQGFSLERTREHLEQLGLIEPKAMQKKTDDYGRPFKKERL